MLGIVFLKKTIYLFIYLQLFFLRHGITIWEVIAENNRIAINKVFPVISITKFLSDIFYNGPIKRDTNWQGKSDTSIE